MTKSNKFDEAKAVHRVLLNKQASLSDHVNIFQKDPDMYEEQTLHLLEKGLLTNSSTKVRAAALCWRTQKRATTKALIMSDMNVSDVLSLLKLLDADRMINALKKKLEVVKNKSKVVAVKQTLYRLEMEKITIPGSKATRSLMKLVKLWTQKIPADKLEFYLLNFPKQPWKDLADYAHLKPQDFQLDYFLKVIFGGDAPEGTLIHVMSVVNSDDPSALVKVLKEYPVLSTCYSYIRSKFDTGLCVTAKKALAATVPLIDVIWFYEELEFPGIDLIVQERLLAGEDFMDHTSKDRATFGKLLERLLLFKKKKACFLSLLQISCEEKLADIKIDSNKSVVVFGDASASMQIAVETATIVASVVCSCLDGTLSFFNNKEFFPSCQPKTVDDVLTITDQVRASKSTAPAACLYPFYRDKKAVDYFIVVTDEEENCSHNGTWHSRTPGVQKDMFADLFKQYVQEVNPNAFVFFVSFLNETEKGQMLKDMQDVGLGEKCVQFRFNKRRPDLCKLTQLLAMLSLETKSNATVTETTVEEKVDEKVEVKDSVPVFCVDGVLNVSKEQHMAIVRAFTDTDTLTMDTVKSVVGKLKKCDAENDGNSSCNSDTWSFVSKTL